VPEHLAERYGAKGWWNDATLGDMVVVDSDCPLDVEIRLAVPLEQMAETTPGSTANRAVNSVPVVCEAAAGIRTSVELSSGRRPPGVDRAEPVTPATCRGADRTGSPQLMTY
jgi:hypothetical protein